MSRGITTTAAATTLAAFLLFCGGCDSAPKTPPQFETGPAEAPSAPVPLYSAVFDVYNKRVEKLNSIWSRADLRVDYVAEDGSKKRDEAEATLQYELPRKFSFMISKVGEHYFTLGSDDSQYWWIDRKNEPPTLIYGRHDLATREKVTTLNLPILPLEFVECMSVTPIPPLKRQPRLSWSPLGKWFVFRMNSLVNRANMVEYWLDPKSLEPGRIRIMDLAGKELVDCWLESPAPVIINGQPDTSTRIASKLRISLPDRQTRLTISLNSMEKRDLSASKAFDLAALKSAYRISREIDLDKSVPPATGAKQ